MLVKINSGSFGKIYKIKEKEKFYALKHIEHKSCDLDSFLEILILYYFDYKYIMNSIDFCIDSCKRSSKILMPLAEMDLYKYIRKKPKNKKKMESKKILWQLSCALGFLHSRNIIHGDVKPSNVLVYEDRILLSDFSFASLSFNESHRVYNKQAYTNFYRAPEVLSDVGYTFKADIYALGCTFYELIYNENFKPGLESYKRLLTESDKNLKNLLFYMLHPCEFKRYNIWQILENPYFVSIKNKESDLIFSLEYKLIEFKNVKEYAIYLFEIFKGLYEQKDCEEIILPLYFYEIIAMKIYNRNIEKSYAIYLNSSFFENEKSLLEKIKAHKIQIF
jgi:serine/threonine protein kinase